MDGREVPRKRKSIFQGGYNGRQISLKDLKIFPSSMTHLQLEEVNGKKVQLETVDLLDSFKENRTVINLDLSGLDTSRVTNMSAMFSWCSYLKSLNVNGWNTENVQSMFEIFNYCSSLSNLDVSGFQTRNVTTMGFMFTSCIGLGSLNVSGFDTTNVTDMKSMFSGCSGLTSLDVSGFNTEKVTSMNHMFGSCSNLTNLDLSGFQTGNVTKMGSMFSRCIQLKIIDFSQCHWVSVPNNVFNFSSTAPLIVISPSQGIKGYNFSSIRPLSWATFKANDGVFSDGSKEKSMQVNQYVYESREALETVGSSQNPACPTRCFLEWRSDVSLSDLPLEELVGQSYHAVWWPYSSRGRTQHHR